MLDCLWLIEDEENCGNSRGHRSCEEWWKLGARKSGMYTINFDSGGNKANKIKKKYKGIFTLLTSKNKR